MIEGASYSIENKHNDFFSNNGMVYNGFSYVDGEPIFNKEGA